MEDLQRLIPIDFTKFPFVTGKMYTHEEKVILDIELTKTEPDGYSFDCILTNASAMLKEDYCLLNIEAIYAMDRWTMVCVFAFKTLVPPEPSARSMYTQGNVVFSAYFFLARRSSICLYFS